MEHMGIEVSFFSFVPWDVLRGWRVLVIDWFCIGEPFDSTIDGSEILQQLIWWISHYLQGSILPAGAGFFHQQYDTRRACTWVMDIFRFYRCFGTAQKAWNLMILLTVRMYSTHPSRAYDLIAPRTFDHSTQFSCSSQVIQWSSCIVVQRNITSTWYCLLTCTWLVLMTKFTDPFGVRFFHAPDLNTHVSTQCVVGDSCLNLRSPGVVS